MRHWLMMSMYGRSPAAMMYGMIRHTVMKLVLLALVITVTVLWFRLRQRRARERDWFQ